MYNTCFLKIDRVHRYEILEIYLAYGFDIQQVFCIAIGFILPSFVLFTIELDTLWKYQTYDKKLKCQFTYRYNDEKYGCLLILPNFGCSY